VIVMLVSVDDTRRAAEMWSPTLLPQNSLSPLPVYLNIAHWLSLSMLT